MRHSITRILSACTVALVLACSDGDAPVQRSGPELVARSTGGMVVSASPIATDVGAGILADGGNAVDAAVGAAFALSVVEPTMSGLGGRTQILIRTSDGSFVGMDGGTEVPASTPSDLSVSEEEGGYEAIGIPGTVAALAEALDQHGTMTLAEVIDRVIPLAEDGFPLSKDEADRIAQVADLLRRFPGARYFLRPDGSPYRGGEVLQQPALARVLAAIAQDGAHTFYEGWIADSIAREMAAHGGFVTLDDLRQYEVLESPVVRGTYRGRDLVGTYLPASGATTIEALQILERLDERPNVESGTWAWNVAQALLASFDDRVADLGSPEEHAATLVSPDWADRRATEISAERTAGLQPVGVSESPFTTHVSVIDAFGGAVSLTQSVGPNMGSKVVASGLGFVYAATMGYLGEQRPGDRPFSSQSPLMVLQDGELILVLGASGARRIISSLVTTVSRVVDGQVDLAEAMAAPRMHPSGERLYVEARDGVTWSTVALGELADAGFEIVEREESDYFAAIQAISIDPISGRRTGVSEPRRLGSSRGTSR